MANEKQTFHSFDDLEGVELSPLPDLDERIPDSLTQKELEERAKQVREEARKVVEWIGANYPHWQRWKGLSREARELARQTHGINEKQVMRFERELERVLLSGQPALQRAGRLAVIRAELFQSMETKEEVDNLLANLTERGYIEESEIGPKALFWAFGKIYTLSPCSLLDDFNPEAEKNTDLGGWIRQVKEGMGSLLKKIQGKAEVKRHSKIAGLRAGETITLGQMLEDKPGVCVLDIPPETTEEGILRQGGILVVESRNRKIWPLTASGTFAQTIEDAISENLYLLLDSLRWETAPFITGLAKEKGAKIRLLWHLLKRAIRAEEEAESLKREREKIQSLKDGLALKATITMAEFFLEGKPGICLVDYQGTWVEKEGNRRFNHLFFLIERKKKRGKDKGFSIKIVEIPQPPEHPEPIAEFLAGYLEEYPEGEKFEGVSQPLKAVLQGIFGQVRKNP